jgi:plastocyanin
MRSRFVALAPLALVILGTALVVGGSLGTASAGPDSGVVRTISARTTVFIPTVLSVPRDAIVSVTFRNDSTEPHNLILLEPIGVGTDPVVDPGQSRTIRFTSPGTGEYTFVCNVHEGMTGVLRVQ